MRAFLRKWNLSFDVKGEVQVGTHKDESTDAEHRGGLPRIGDEGR